MAINRSRLVTQPSAEREDTRVTCLYISSAIPPDARMQVNPDGTIEGVPQPPEREGQMTSYSPADSGDAYIYVVVDVDGDLAWKPCYGSTGPIDPYTGYPFQSL